MTRHEPGAPNVAKWLRTSSRLGWTKYLCAMNLGEILYATERRFGDERKIELLAHIHRIHFTILPVPSELIYQAAEYKADYRISYADCFLLACAVHHSATVVTGDPEFRNVRQLVRIHWI